MQDHMDLACQGEDRGGYADRGRSVRPSGAPVLAAQTLEHHYLRVASIQS